MINAQTQVKLRVKVAQPKINILEVTMDNMQGAYTPRAGTYVSVEVVLLMACTIIYNGEIYVKLTNGTLLQKG